MLYMLVAFANWTRPCSAINKNNILAIDIVKYCAVLPSYAEMVHRE